MKQWRRLIFYLVLNILVSACTTFAVLYYWDRTHSPLPGGLLNLPEGLPVVERAATRAPAAAGAQASQPAPAGPTATPVFTAYQVVSGDTFESIAAKFNMSVDELIAVNGFSKSQPLGDGEVLRIPVHPLAGIEIESVAGVGDLESERVMLKHRGEGEISLVGWQLEDAHGNIFIFPEFPQLTLFKGGAVNVYTKAGTNTVVDVFWGLDHPVWESGETVTLRDAQHEVRSEYKIP